MAEKTTQQKDHESYKVFDTCKTIVNHVVKHKYWILPSFSAVVGYSQTGSLFGAIVGTVFGIGINALIEAVYEYVTAVPGRLESLKNWVFKGGPKPTDK